MTDKAVGRVTNVLLAGVGGQGTILAGKILAEVLRRKGYDVKLSEIHGMSQRGGSVVTYVRFGDKVFAPTVERGQADFLLAFEKLEARRWAPFLRPEGIVVVNDQAIQPLPVSLGRASYPAGVTEELRRFSRRVAVVDGAAMAARAGDARTQNMALCGVLARRMGAATREDWEAVIAAAVPPKTVPANLAAFGLGWDCPGSTGTVYPPPRRGKPPVATLSLPAPLRR